MLGLAMHFRMLGLSALAYHVCASPTLSRLLPFPPPHPDRPVDAPNLSLQSRRRWDLNGVFHYRIDNTVTQKIRCHANDTILHVYSIAPAISVRSRAPDRHVDCPLRQ